MIATRYGPSLQDYEVAFESERNGIYALVDDIERLYGYALDRKKLEDAAKVLACPVKANPPNWQHGRVLYAVARDMFTRRSGECFTILDIGTAKGFSALCLLWALNDSKETGTVISLDVIDPKAHIARNTIAELQGLKTLRETLEPWPEAQSIFFEKAPGLHWLNNYDGPRIQFAFVDGKHSGSVVKQEAHRLAMLQQTGDVIVFDDVHLPDVWDAVLSLKGYDIDRLTVIPKRAYALAVKQ